MSEYFICNTTIKNSFTIPTLYSYQICYYIAVADYNSQPKIMIASKNVTILAKILRLHG